MRLYNRMPKCDTRGCCGNIRKERCEHVATTHASGESPSGIVAWRDEGWRQHNLRHHVSYGSIIHGGAGGAGGERSPSHALVLYIT